LLRVRIELTCHTNPQPCMRFNVPAMGEKKRRRGGKKKKRESAEQSVIKDILGDCEEAL